MKLLKFEAPWCTACTQLTRIMESMTVPYPVERIDIDQNHQAAIEFGVRSVPHMVIVDDNQNIVKRIVGVFSEEQLTKAFTQL